MQHYSQLAETMNALLERDGILPSLAYVPIRVRPVLQNPKAPPSSFENRAAAEPGRRWATAGASRSAVVAAAAGQQRWRARRRGHAMTMPATRERGGDPAAAPVRRRRPRRPR